MKVKKTMIFGAMGLGGSWNLDDPITQKDLDQGQAALDTALEGNINFIDLADIYHNGKSEMVVGAFLKNNTGLRESLIIQSKVGIQLTGADFGSRFNFSYDHIVNSVDGILERLGTSYLDILLLHRPDPLMQKNELKKAIDILFFEGKIRALGVSNMSKDQMLLIESWTERKLVANQLELSLKKHDFVSSMVGFNNPGGKGLDFPIGTIEHCMLNDISLQAWSPLARGIYSGRELDADVPETVIKTKEVVNRLAREKGFSSEAIVLAWLLKHPAGIRPVIGTSNPERIKRCLEAVNVEMSRDEWYELLVMSRGIPMP